MDSERRRNGDVQLEILTERVNGFIDRYDKDEKKAEEWRGKFCSKLDDFREDIAKLPCSKGHDIHVDRQLGAIWWLVSVCLISVVTVGVAWGAMSKQLEVNTDRWSAYLQEQKRTEWVKLK